MTLNIDLSPQEEAWINNEAQIHGLKPVDVVRRLIDEHAVIAKTPRQFKTPQERIKAMDELAEKNAGLPVLPNSAFDRGNIYEDRL